MADKDVDHDLAANPGTEPFVPDFDTGEDSVPFVPNFDDTGSQPSPLLGAAEEPAKSREKAPAKDEPEAARPAADEEAASEAVVAPVQSVTVPGRYQYVKWWKLLLVILGVWFAAAEVGLSLFYWWYHTIDKTAAVYIVLVYIVACTVAGVMLAMVEGRPMISALALAVMSGPFASVAAAAPLYGYYSCARTGHCLAGFIPF